MGPELLRRMSREGWITPNGSFDSPEDRRNLASAIRSPMIIIADPVVEGFCQRWKTEDGLHFHPDQKDMHDLMPPFDRYWMECPLRGLFAGPPGRSGILFNLIARDEGGWNMEAMVALGKSGGPVAFPIFSLLYKVRSDGLLESEIKYFSIRDNVTWMPQFIHRMVYPCLAAHGLIHCKNIDLQPRAQNPDDVKRMQRRFGDGGYQYHVLTIRPKITRSFESDRHREGSEVLTPLHVRRGHKKHYGPKYGKGLLFGSIEGVFWCPPTEVGHEKNGVVDKDYAIA